ncbi:MAG: polysaccharide export protein [Rhodobacteraceae bacterium]|jgi:polysaccharide export outer membrane protein|nr:polysaccharide export protein [Paracoccaceae bacterium]
MKLLHAVVAALLLLPLVAAQGMAQQDYRLQPGDVVQIEVLEDATLSRTAIVLPDGQISLPLAGSIRAAGRSLAQVQSALAAELASSFATPPTVFVTLSALAERLPPEPPRLMNIYILGAANSPGRVEVPPHATLMQGIAAGGGLSPFAATKRVQLRRVDRSGNEQVYQFNIDAAERGGGTGLATRLHEGDVIFVPQRRLFE